MRFPALCSVAIGFGMAALPALGEEVNPAKRWDVLWDHVLIDLLVIGVVFAVAALWMLFKYRAKNPNDLGQGPKLTKGQALAWALIPVAIFMADDFYLAAQGWTLWGIYRHVPDNALEVKVIAHQWYWEFDYGNNVITQELKVPVGRPVVLRMRSEDVIHDFFLPKYRVKEDVMPGRITYVWFLPDEETETLATCTMYCGAAHSQMFGKVSVISPAKYSSWLETATKQANAEDNKAGSTQPADAQPATAAVTKG
jgi:cytochrome c oxidase subunit 2